MEKNLTAKKKAEHLIMRMWGISSPTTTTIDQIKESDGFDDAKYCALICCNEVLGYMGADRGYEFWTSVKQEIEKL